jgi:proton-dependent oligopeptide transporter, POT family
MFNNIKAFYRGPGLLISTVMWESFSIFGLRALLILYLTQVLAFSDAKAFEIYAGFISLVWVSPVVGGWIADQYLGFKYSVYIGASLIILGHIVLGLTSSNSLYIGLSLLICGMGFFKTNAICMVGSYYPDQPEKTSAMMTLYYIGMNVGSTLGPIVCAYLQKYFGYRYAFSAAAVGMSIGLVILALNRKRFAGFANPVISTAECCKKGLLAVLPFVCLIICLSLILKYNAASYLLIVCFLVFAYIVWKKLKYLSTTRKKNLLFLLLLTLVATFFWLLDQQGGSSISLFILRNVNRAGIPTAAFQAINPLVVIVVGLMCSFFLPQRGNNVESNKMGLVNKVNLLSLFNIMLGLGLLTLGYALIAFSAAMSAKGGLVSFYWPAIGMSLMGAAEIFIDPVILSLISIESPKELLGLLTAIYYLFVGALANFLSGKVAMLSAIPVAIAKNNDIRLSGQVYFKTFGDITEVSVIVLLLLGLIAAFMALKRYRREGRWI